MQTYLVKLIALFLALWGTSAPCLAHRAAPIAPPTAESRNITGLLRLGDDPTATPAPTWGEEAAQTEEADPTPDPVDDAQLDAGYLDEWFDGSVMIGDSIVAGLSNFVQNERYQKHTCLGEMKFASASAFTLKKAMQCEKKQRVGELLFRGKYMTISEVVSSVQAGRAFIMIGASDLRWFTVDEFIEAYDSILEIVAQSNPETRIYITSVVPMVKEYADTVKVNAEQNRELNQSLQAYCQEKGYGYVEIADYVRDEEGYLDRQYSASDYRFHLNGKGKTHWIRSLREIARQEYYEGEWTPSR